MRRVAYTNKDAEVLARLMRAESLSDGAIGMILVGGVGSNRILASCDTFRNITTVQKMVFQKPGGFASTNSPIFNSRPNSRDLRLAKLVLNGERFKPAIKSLYFYAPKITEKCRDEWFGAKFVGRYRSHCYYSPSPKDCPSIY